ncbi:MAG: serine--tRNA ligase [Acetobacteraceae bacterium]|nr:serine--tRNA ligase [Acetobacteraceae bacterium]
MLDLKLIREDPEGVLERLRRRDPTLSLDELLAQDKRRRELLVQVERLKQQRNRASDEIAELKRQGRDASAEIAQMQEVARRVRELDQELKACEADIERLLVVLPNLPHPSVPVSQRKEDKVLLREWGRKPELGFKPRNHVELGRALGILDFERAARIAGAQFPMHVGLGARLEWALLSLMIDMNVREHGYTLVLPPYLANPTSLFVAGNLPKFGDQLYRCESDDLYLIPTAEVSLANLHRGEILSESDLPLRYAAYSACFRREAGTYGAGERGLIRVHQFNKVELFKFTTAETSYDELDSMVQDAERILQRLGLHYRVMLLPSGDIAQQSAKTVDIEVWLPAQEAYYEVSSCSNCEDYQARGGNVRYRTEEGRIRFVHTLNGSGLATPRLMVAILESFQQEDGSVVVPPALRPYLGGVEAIR